jgi:hypothetical protein
MRNAKEHRLVACSPSGVELRFDANSTKEQRDNESVQHARLAHRPPACVPPCLRRSQTAATAENDHSRAQCRHNGRRAD